MWSGCWRGSIYGMFQFWGGFWFEKLLSRKGVIAL